MDNVIQIFYACDDNFVKYTIVSVKSLIENCSKGRNYHIHVLNTGISRQMQDIMLAMQSANVKISFDDVTEYIHSIKGKLPIRDYYTKTTYYRFFIAEMFPEYKKALYVDSDTVVLGDISELFDTHLQDNYVAGTHDQAMVQVDEYGTYVERVCGVDRNAYFQAGVLLINCDMFRKKKILEKFEKLLSEFDFKVTQDEDYLNVLCKDRVKFVSSAWNCAVFGTLPCEEKDIKVIHYIMVSKPWHYYDCRLKEYFWKYADMTPVKAMIEAELAAYTDEERARDAQSCDNLLSLAVSEAAREDTYYQLIKKNYSSDRVAVLNRIKELEDRGIYDIDVEEDPPSKVLYAKDIDYLRKKFTSKVKASFSFAVARKFVKNLRKNDQLIMNDIVGLENLASLQSGAIITCNHFNAFDSFAMHLTYYASKQKKRKFFRVIREGNYTSFPGIYGFFMRNCNTLPLSSDFETQKVFMRSVDTLLKQGHFVLVYPEQSMWWNYRKPRPMKAGAFRFAAKSNVPVLPCFITMRDTGIIGADGFPVQEYTVHIEKPIYPPMDKGEGARAKYLQEKNEEVWRTIYENSYGMSADLPKAKVSE